MVPRTFFQNSPCKWAPFTKFGPAKLHCITREAANGEALYLLLTVIPGQFTDRGVTRHYKRNLWQHTDGIPQRIPLRTVERVNWKSQTNHKIRKLGKLFFFYIMNQKSLRVVTLFLS